MLTFILILSFNFEVGAEVTEPVVVRGFRSRHDTQHFRQKPLSEDQDLAPKLLALPNLNYASGANKPRFYQVRGIGETSQFEHAQVNAFGVFYEGIDFSEEASAVPLLGRESLTTSFGPRTLDWGGKALVGSLELNSCLERACSQQQWQVSVGDHRTLGVRGGRAGKWWAGGASYSSSDGYMYNDFLDRATGEQREAEAVLGVNYGWPGLQVRQHHVIAHHRNGYDHWAFEPSFTTQSDHPGWDRHQVHGHSVQWHAPAGETTLRGLTSFTFTRQSEAYDEDWANNEYWQRVAAQNYNYFAEFERHRRKLHQKLAWDLAGGLEIGAHYYRFTEAQVLRSFKDDSLRRIEEPEFNSSNSALYISKIFDHAPFTLSLGARGEAQHIELVGVGEARSQEVAPQWSADLRLKRAWTEDFFSDLSLQRGFRGGGYNTSSSVTEDRIGFQPEQLYLAQLATQWEGGERGAILRVFHQWHEHAQARSSFQTDPSDPNSFTYFTTNVGGSRGLGAELVSWYRWRRWLLNANVGWLRSRHTDYTLGGRDLSGRETAQAPSWTDHVRLEYSPAPWSVWVQFSGRDGFYHSVEHDFQTRPYHVWDVGTAYRTKICEWRFSVTNVFDQRYSVRGYYFANEPPEWEPKLYSQLGPPRSFGINVVFPTPL